MLPVFQNRPVRSGVKRYAGRRRDQETKTETAARRYAPDGFLKQRFKALFDYSVFDGADTREIEEQFYTSLNHLSRLYKFSPYVNTGFSFPLNIHHSYSHAKAEMEKRKNKPQLSIATEDGKCALITSHSINPGWTLYYLPLETIARLHSRKKTKAMQLLLSVFSYLNKVARMPLSDENDYLSNSYDMVEEWLVENIAEYEEDDFTENLMEVKEFRRKERIICNAVRNPVNLLEFKKRIDAFKPKDKVEKQFRKVCVKIHALYLRYPKHHFYKNIFPDPDRDEDDYPIEPDEYFTFFWNSHGWLHDNLMHYVNADLQEKSYFDAPAAVQWFDQPQRKKTHKLDFENRLLNLICELASVIDRL